jgi:hypothetical protein
MAPVELISRFPSPYIKFDFNAGEVSRALTGDKRHDLEITMAARDERDMIARLCSITCWLQLDCKESCGIFG